MNIKPIVVINTDVRKSFVGDVKKIPIKLMIIPIIINIRPTNDCPDI